MLQCEFSFAGSLSSQILIPEKSMSKVVVLTALQLEFKAARHHLKNVKSVTHNGSSYEVGQFGGLEILIAEATLPQRLKPFERSSTSAQIP